MGWESYSKIRKYYVEGGSAEVLRRLKGKLSYLVYHTNDAYWFRMDLRGEIAHLPVDEGIVVDFDNPDQTIRYIREHGYFYPREIETGLSVGHLFSSLKYEGETIGYNKTGYLRVYIQDFRREYQFPDEVAFSLDTFIESTYRGRKFGGFLLSEVTRKLKSRGFRSIWGHIPPWNSASVNMLQKLGWSRQKRIAYYWVLGVSWITTDPVRYIKQIEKLSRSPTPK